MKRITSNRGRYKYTLTRTELRDQKGFVLQKTAMFQAGRPDRDIRRFVLVLHAVGLMPVPYNCYFDSKAHLVIGCREFDRRNSAIILRWAFGTEGS